MRKSKYYWGKTYKRLIPLFIPKSFIEVFKKKAELSKHNIRTNADIIFTSSCHYTGFDVEKSWITSQKEKAQNLLWVNMVDHYINSI